MDKLSDVIRRFVETDKEDVSYFREAHHGIEGNISFVDHRLTKVGAMLLHVANVLAAHIEDAPATGGSPAGNTQQANGNTPE
jgi:hypothetical protein